MGRVLLIIGLVVAVMAVGPAIAAPGDGVRVPFGIVDDQESPSGTVVVERGDHLWKISERHLGPNTPDRQVAPYWREVIEVNTPTLRSGDPDLIYPGEVVALPEVSERP